MARTVTKSIIAKGEATGHVHKLAQEIDVIHDEDTGLRHFMLTEPVELVHEEHETIILPAGKYLAGIAQEYDHAHEESHAVRD